jgi:hypothetical protein
LLVLFRISQGNPFKYDGSGNPPETSNPWYFIIPETSGVHSITKDGKGTELEFKFGNLQLPLWATDVQLRLIFKDHNGYAFIGQKDISEPTPYTSVNNNDWIVVDGIPYQVEDPITNSLVLNMIGNTFENECIISPKIIWGPDMWISPGYFDMDRTRPRGFQIYSTHPGNFSRVFMLGEYTNYLRNYPFYFVSYVDERKNHDPYSVVWDVSKIWMSRFNENQYNALNEEDCKGFALTYPCSSRTVTSIGGTYRGIEYYHGLFCYWDMVYFSGSQGFDYSSLDDKVFPEPVWWLNLS